MTTARYDSIAFEPKTVLKTGLFVFAQLALWLGGILATAGLTWCPMLLCSDESAGLMMVALTLWVGMLQAVSHVTSPFGRIRFRALTVPSLLYGFALPFPWMIPYVLLLVLFEITWNKLNSKKSEISRSPVVSEAEGFDEEILDENILQQIVRSRTEDGKDRIEGTFLLEYLDDQLTATVHVPFVPPFETAPKIEAFLLDDEDAKTTVGPAQPFGVRVDVKRKSLDGSAKIRLALIAEE